MPEPVKPAPVNEGKPAPLGDPKVASTLLSGFMEEATPEATPPAEPPKPAEPPVVKLEPDKTDKKPIAQAIELTPPKVDLKTVPAELRAVKPGSPLPVLAPAPVPAPVPDAESELDQIEKAHPGAVNAKIRLTIKELKARTEKAEAAAQARASAPPAEVKIEDHPAVKELQTKLAAAEDTLGRMNLQAHPQYQAQLVKPEQDMLTQGREYLKAVKADEKLLDDLVRMPLAERIAKIDEEAPSAKALLIPLLSQVDKIRETRSIVDAKYKENLQKWDAESRMQAAQQNEQIRAQLYEQALAVRAQAGDILLRELPGQDEWNKSIGVIKQMAKAYFHTNDVNMQAQAFVKAAQFDVLHDLYLQQNALVASLQEEIEAMTRATPGFRAERGAAPTTPATPPSDVQDAGSAANDLLRTVMPGPR